MRNHCFFDYFGSQLDSGLSESKPWVTICAPLVLWHLAGCGEYAFLEVADCLGIDGEFVVRYLVYERLFPHVHVSGVAWVIYDFMYRLSDLPHIILFQIF